MDLCLPLLRKTRYKQLSVELKKANNSGGKATSSHLNVSFVRVLVGDRVKTKRRRKIHLPLIFVSSGKEVVGLFKELKMWLFF